MERKAFGFQLIYFQSIIASRDIDEQKVPEELNPP